MPNISWNEIGQRALNFSRSWQHATSEQADKQTFWNDFFDIFGRARRDVAAFEVAVKRLTGTTGSLTSSGPASSSSSTNPLATPSIPPNPRLSPISRI